MDAVTMTKWKSCDIVCDFSTSCCVIVSFASLFLFFFEFQGIVRLKNNKLAAPWLFLQKYFYYFGRYV